MSGDGTFKATYRDWRFMKEFRIFLNDEPGSLADHCDAIAAAGVNILAIAGIGESGASAALLTDNPEATQAALSEMGAKFNESDLKTATLDHKPGALAAFTRGIAESGINLRSLYVMSVTGGQATIGYTTD